MQIDDHTIETSFRMKRTVSKAVKSPILYALFEETRQKAKKLSVHIIHINHSEWTISTGLIKPTGLAKYGPLER